MADYPSDLADYIEQKVLSGEFGSPADFAMEAVRLYRDLEVRHRTLKGDVAAAIEQARRGEVDSLDIESLKQELLDGLDDEGNAR